MSESVPEVVLVCGAGSGIGRAVALSFASRGVISMICIDLSLENAKKTVEDVIAMRKESKKELRCIAMTVDVRSEEDLASVFARSQHFAGRLDVCVNTAGFETSGLVEIRNMTLEEYRSQVEVHNIGGFLFLKTALRTLLEQSPQKAPGGLHPSRGAIVMLTSLASEGGFLGIGNYTAAKFAVKGLVQTAALENARKGIRINAVAPSYVRGPMMESILEQMPALKTQILGDLAMGRLAEPDEVANVVAFLGSSQSSYINGHTLVVDGGSSLQLANAAFTEPIAE
ncbi:NAD(P)-binding protein [Lophiostoma macrostomum CBS 122681]|uniref:NAD(P)-binding protein n=1 Tax=Lophiostoma macrostomum CBS 122681 TaxID=1314788 RepID=A0A6A6TM60_9PLEO|nr:NAD(P)-binding protein [Lophiostoma macrostomum CBS 122681]